MKALMRRAVLAGTAAAICSFNAVAVQAGPWTNPSGDGGDFTFSNGGDINGLFGEPAIGTNAIAFPSASFVVNAAAADSTDHAFDTVSFNMVIDAGLLLSNVNVFALGAYNVTGQGAFVNLTDSLSISEIDGSQRAFVQDLLTSVQFPIEFGQGGWNGSVEMDLSTQFPPLSQNLHVELSADLFADGGISGGAFLSQSFESVAFQFSFIPEPGTLALLVLGGWAAMRRRR